MWKKTSDFVTYPSLWEGWGNQLLEALRARLPLMLFEYPVYQADIKSKGLRREMVEQNFRVARQHYLMESLKSYLGPLME